MNPGRISFFVTNFADEIGGNVHVAVLPAQLGGDLLGPGTDAAVDFRIERLAREDVLIHGIFVGSSARALQRLTVKPIEDRAEQTALDKRLRDGEQNDSGDTKPKGGRTGVRAGLQRRGRKKLK
jgi:hypothetical protein